jgi:hypothetical protein
LVPTLTFRGEDLGAGTKSWHGVVMKKVGWFRKVCLGCCMNERDNLHDLTTDAPVVVTEALSSRATIAEATGGSATAAAALGALAIGGLAVGFLAIGRLIIREMLIKQVHLRHLKIDQLEVEDLRVSKLTVMEEQRPTGGPDNPPARHVE